VGSPIAVYDACVLYPAPLRDLLMRLALADLVRARWTGAIHDEWTRNLLCNRPDLTPTQVHRTRELMDAHAPDAIVSGYEHLTAVISLPDPNDRHVLAAAIHCSASVIVTFNLADFPHTALQPYAIEAIHPDPFIVRLIEKESAAVWEAVKQQHASLQRPPMTLEQLLDVLKAQGLKDSVERLVEAAI
jgi:hypothetical protein